MPVFAGDDSINAHIAHTLYMIFKVPDQSCLANINEYQQHSFVYNGIRITAFKSKTSNWAGFFKQLSAQNLPVDALSEIKSRFKGCVIENVAMYFNKDADISYFAKIALNNTYTILKIQPSGKMQVMNCIDF